MALEKSQSNIFCRSFCCFAIHNNNFFFRRQQNVIINNNPERNGQLTHAHFAAKDQRITNTRTHFVAIRQRASNTFDRWQNGLIFIVAMMIMAPAAWIASYKRTLVGSTFFVRILQIVPSSGNLK